MKKNEGLYAKYFTVNPNRNDIYGKASRAAILAYARFIQKENPEFCDALRDWVSEIAAELHEKE